MQMSWFNGCLPKGEREMVLLRRKRDEMETALLPPLLLLMGKYNCWGKELHPRYAGRRK